MTAAVPTTLKALRGTDQPCRLNPNEPKLKAEVVRCPPELKGEARREFKRTAKLLAEAGITTAIDKPALVGYSLAWGRLHEALEHLEQEEMIVPGINGAPMINQWKRLEDIALADMRRFAVELGMTPSARTKVSAVGKPQKKSDWEKL